MKTHPTSESSLSPNAPSTPFWKSIFGWERFGGKLLSVRTLPLLAAAVAVEAVIITCSWQYQKNVSVPPGMKILFLGLSPLGATMLAVELLKLPMAIWVSSCRGWFTKTLGILALVLISCLTFQLVKDMGVYELETATKPAQAYAAQAAAVTEEINVLEKELANTRDDRQLAEEKTAKLRAQYQTDLAALTQKLSKGKEEIAAKKVGAQKLRDDAFARAEATRMEAVTPTEYEKKELAEAESRQAAVVAQFNADTEQLTKAITDLRTRREAELARTSAVSADWEARKKQYDGALAKWNAEEARIENAYQQAMLNYNNAKAKYEKDRIEYLTANDLKRQFLKEPVSPGLPPVREVNAVPKPAAMDAPPSALLGEFDGQIKAKEDELAAANTKRRDRIAQIEADVRQLRQEIARRGGLKTDDADQKREAASAAFAAEIKQLEASEAALGVQYEKDAKALAQGLQADEAKIAAQLKERRGRDVVGKEITAKRAQLEELYKERVNSLESTQVHRIATTVDIIRVTVFGKAPVPSTLPNKEKGDAWTGQIDMVRVAVYPVFAFLVAFLPTLLVEVGFSTLFEKEQKRPNYRVGFLGRRLHDLYKRAGSQKIARAERMIKESSGVKAKLENQLESLRAAHAQELEAKEDEIKAVESAKEEEFNAREMALREQDIRWNAKYEALANTLNRITAEKDALRDMQGNEIERQVQLRQKAWEARLVQAQKDLDKAQSQHETQRVEAEQEYQKKMLKVVEEANAEVSDARRRLADAQLAQVEATAKLAQDLKEANRVRNEFEDRVRQQQQSHASALIQQQENADRALEKAVRDSRAQLEQAQAQAAKALAAKDDEADRRVKQREQELAAKFEAQLSEVQTQAQQALRQREASLAKNLEERLAEAAAKHAEETKRREELAQARADQREQQLTAKIEEARHLQKVEDAKALQAREAELARATQARLAEAAEQFEKELARREEVAQLKAKQREQEGADKVEAAVRLAEAAAQQKLARQDEAAQARARAREVEFAAKLEAQQEALRKQWEQEMRAASLEWERQAELRQRGVESRLQEEFAQKEELAQIKLRQREQQVLAQADARISEAKAKFEQEARRREIEQERVAEARLQEAEARLKQELQQRDEAAAIALKQREQQWQAQQEAQAAELAERLEREARRREAELARNADAKVKALEARTQAEASVQEELFHSRFKQREQQLAMQAEAKAAEMARAAESRLGEVEARLKQEGLRREEAAYADAKQREQALVAQLGAQFESRLNNAVAQAEADAKKRATAQVEVLKAQLARVEQEREEARQAARAADVRAQEWEKKLGEVSSFLSGMKK